jgi:endonuclease/exonuclease/phosphatase family metal-dependent hydrolase
MLLRLLRSSLLTAVCWLALFLNLAIWIAIRQADALALPTLLSYGPRWIWLLLPCGLLPTVPFRRARLIPLAAALAIGLVPILQFEFPSLRALRQGGTTTPLITVVTMNAGMQLSGASLENLVRSTGADIVALQEWRGMDGAAPAIAGYTASCEASLCVLSRFPMRPGRALDRQQIGGYHLMAMKTHLTTPEGEITFANVHLETVREGVEAVLRREPDGWQQLRANITFRDLESRVVSTWVADTPDPLIIAGDFNLPTDSAIYRSTWSRWSNAFGVAGWGWGSTKYTSWWGIRIDHVLVDERVWSILDAAVGPALGSDHRPGIARLQRR